MTTIKEVQRTFNQREIDHNVALVSCSHISQMIDIMENCDYKISESVIREIDKIC